MKYSTFLYRLILAVAVCFLPTAALPPAARAQNSWCSTSSITWAHGDTTPKMFTISSRDSAAYVLNVSACSHFLMQSPTGSYSVSVTPFGANYSQSDIVQYLFVVIDDNGTPVTETVTLRHLAAPVQPEPDPWAEAVENLPDTLSWIQRTTVTSADGSSSFRDVTFYDGLGYPSQEVLVGASPGGLKSIYTPVVYDDMRRADVRTYLPYAAATAAEVHDPSAITRQASFYASLPYQDTRPYAEKVYETSPAGRPLSALREGDAWYGNGGNDSHRSNFSYRTNTAADAVPRYRILPPVSAGQTTKATFSGFWPESSLHCTETEDEEGSVSRTWTDAFGKTVLTESETGNLLPGGGREKARTLFIYDLRDSLAVVVQPEGYDSLFVRSPNGPKDISLDADSGSNHGITDKWCFVWTYDGWGNVLSEHTPGGGTTRYAYDARNRQVLKTDGRMNPSDTPSSRRMILTLHDQYDRIVEERYVSSPASTFAALRSYLRDTVLHTMSIPSVSAMLPTLRTLRSAEYFPFTAFSYPSSGDGAFTPEPGFATVDDLETVRIKGFLRQETIHPAPDVDGSIPAGAPSVTRYYHYDSRGRVIQLYECWSDGRFRRVSTKYSFTGDVLATKETVSEGASLDGFSSLAAFYTRDPRGRVLSCSRVLNGTDTLATVHYAYDELGRLVGKTVGDGSAPALETTLAYDLHGWTTGVGVAVTDGSGIGMNTVFSETLCYASHLKNPNADRYDGNISETAFSHRVVPSSGSPYLQTNTWSYAYDGLKRLTDANHYAGGANTPSLTDTERDIAYDRNGNITTLKRYGSAGLENNLSFTHDGNRMTALADANATGNDAGTKSFTYDANGNLTSDGRKGLELSWNLLNLVSCTGMHDGNDVCSLTYAWLSDGTPVSATLGEGNLPGRLYNGSFVFATDSTRMDIAESVAWDEGRIFFSDPDTTDCWYAGDHLGNVRSVIDISRGQAVPQVLEQSDYLPYGTRINNLAFALMSGENRWRYAGKEEQRLNCLVTDPFAPDGEYNRSLDLGLLDFGARMYDPFSARWTAVDPMARKSAAVSPFVFCDNNSILYSDPKGLEVLVAEDYQEQFRHDLQRVFGGKNMLFYFDEKGSLRLEGNVKDFIKGMTRDQKEAFYGLKIAMDDKKVTSVVYADNYNISINNEIRTVDVVKEYGGGLYSKTDNLIIIAPSVGSVDVQLDKLQITSEGLVFPSQIVQQNTTSALFHEIGERNTTDIEFRGSVIDYENHVRRTIGLPLRPYDLNHSKTISTKYK